VPKCCSRWEGGGRTTQPSRSSMVWNVMQENTGAHARSSEAMRQVKGQQVLWVAPARHQRHNANSSNLRSVAACTGRVGGEGWEGREQRQTE